MNVRIRRVCDADVETLVDLTLRAFVPVFESFPRLLGPKIYPMLWPDWKQSQRDAVERFCRDSEKPVVLVAETDAEVVGFAAYEIRSEGNTGEVLLVAVDPNHQRQGIGTQLNEQALREMAEAGVKLAIVEAGGDASHAPARRSYEKAGYTALPLVRYFKKL